MARRQFKTMTDDERERDYSSRLERGLPFIESDLPQFRARDGENFIRIVPPLADDDLAGSWGVDIMAHYIEGYGWLLSPKSLDQTNFDPVDDLIRELRSIDPELEKIVKPNRKTVIHILDFNADERYGVLKLYAAPPTLIEDFIKQAKDKRSGRTHSLEDPVKGLPISFDKSGAGLATRYTGIQLERDPFPLDDEVLDAIEYFEDVLVVEDTDALTAICDKILAGAQAGGRNSRGRGRGRGRDRDDPEDAPEPRRGRGRDRDDPEDEPRGRGRGRGRDRDDPEDAPEPRRGRGRDRDDPEDEPEPRGRGRGRGRDDDDGGGPDAVRDRVRDKLGDDEGGRGGFRRRPRDEDPEEPEVEDPEEPETEEEEDEPPPPRRGGGRGGSKKKAAGKKKTTRGSRR